MRMSFRALIICALIQLLSAYIPGPGFAQSQDTEGKVKPIRIRENPPAPVNTFGLPEDDPVDPTASPNPFIPMLILDENSREIVNAIPIMEDMEVSFAASSDIFAEQPPEQMNQRVYEGATWVKSPTVMWTINEVKTGKSQLAHTKTFQFHEKFKDPGEYLIACYAYRDFTYRNKGNTFRLTAISSRGIACFVADATPPELTLMMTEYLTGKRSTIKLTEFPADQPFGQKTWEMTYDGFHFDLSGAERKTGSVRGPLQSQNLVDLNEQKNIPRLVLKKGITYLINVEVKDNFKVAKKEWNILNQNRKSILGGINVQKFQLPDDGIYLGKNTLELFVEDKGGNRNELKLPIQIVPR